MKKVLALLLAMVLVLSLAACGGGGKANEDSENNSDSSSTSEIEETEKDYNLSDSEIKELVEQALVDEIESTYTSVDPYKTRYEISNTERDSWRKDRGLIRVYADQRRK